MKTIEEIVREAHCDITKMAEEAERLHWEEKRMIDRGIALALFVAFVCFMGLYYV